MTDRTSRARRIGFVRALGDGSEVFEEGGVFYAVGATLVITPDDREIVQATRSEDFPTLEAFVASLPAGARFVPAKPVEEGG